MLFIILDFNIQKTSSYQHLSDWEKNALHELYIDYFFRRQDGLWHEKAMEKLPMLLSATDMLICGEDLGLVPDCVPGVMECFRNYSAQSSAFAKRRCSVLQSSKCRLYERSYGFFSRQFYIKTMVERKQRTYAELL